MYEHSSLLRQRFLHGLDRLAAEAGGTIVPGDTSRWTDALTATVQDLESNWKPYLSDLRKLLRAIEREDMSLRPRAQELRRDIRRLSRNWRSLRMRLTDLTERADDRIDPRKISDLGALRDDLQTWVIEVRSEDEAATTWYLEAFLRDRGVVD